jgi:hypothetical protein
MNAVAKPQSHSHQDIGGAKCRLDGAQKIPLANQAKSTTMYAVAFMAFLPLHLHCFGGDVQNGRQGIVGAMDAPVAMHVQLQHPGIEERMTLVAAGPESRRQVEESRAHGDERLYLLLCQVLILAGHATIARFLWVHLSALRCELVMVRAASSEMLKVSTWMRLADADSTNDISRAATAPAANPKEPAP